MTTKTMIISVFMITVSALLGGAARADLISIDFNHVNSPATTASGTVTDVNGHDSLPGQVGAWNALLVAQSGANYQDNITYQYTSGTLLDGSGNATGVSLVINTNHVLHFALLDTASPRTLQRDMIGVQKNMPSMDWTLSGLEANTVYRLRMFGRESGAGATVVSLAKFTATGATTDNAISVLKRNCSDLWVKSTAGGVISGTVDDWNLNDAAAWSGMQIEWNVPQAPVVSIDFGHGNTSFQGAPASGTVVDGNGALSLPGQVGSWNELLMGLIAGNYFNESNTKPKITGLKDGKGRATTVFFTFNTGGNTYTTFATTQADPLRTALHRDTVYVLNTAPKTVAYWQIAGLQATNQYTLKLFGYQNTTLNLFADFSATGLNTATGSTSFTKNYVDLVVTSSVSGQINGMLTNQTGQAGSAWAGLQIQGVQPFLLARDLISIDFDIGNPTLQIGTASGAITDVNGDTTWGQAGVWNQLLSGDSTIGNFAFTTLQPSVSGLLDGEGNATTVAFQFNTGTPVSYYTYSLNFNGTGTILHGDMVGVTAGEASWQLTGLQPDTWYTLRMFGQQTGIPPANFATFSARGNCSDIGSTSLAKNYVDLTVASTAAGQITGKLIKGASGGASWSGMQILKLARDPWVPQGTVIVVY